MKLLSLILGGSIIMGFSFVLPYVAQVNAVKSIQKIDEGVYFLDFEGNYCFDEYIAKGGGKSNDEMSAFITDKLKKGKWTSPKKKSDSAVNITMKTFGCASIAAHNGGECGGMIFGRNYDWKTCAVLVVHTKPDNGYESVSTCCLEHLGINADWEPKHKFPADATALAAIYVPMDGMNEKGVYIADLIAGKDEITAQNRGNASVTTTAAIRLVLDHASSVDEALELLEKHDMYSVIGYAHHFAIADNTGKSVAVEWVDNKMYVTESPVLTNHYITDSPKKDTANPETENSHTRFNTLQAAGEKSGWKLSGDETRDALQSVRAGQFGWENELSVWSAVFEPQARKVTYYFREKYDNPVTITF